MLALKVELSGICSGKSGDMPREFDRGDLHPKAEPEIRHAVLASILRCPDLSFDAALAKPARHEDARDVTKLFRGIAALEPLRFDLFHFDPAIARSRSGGDRLENGFIRVLVVRVLADQRDLHVLLRLDHPFDEPPPLRH